MTQVQLTPLQYDVLTYLHTGRMPDVPASEKRWENALEALRCKGLIFRVSGEQYSLSMKGERAAQQDRPKARERV